MMHGDGPGPSRKQSADRHRLRPLSGARLQGLLDAAQVLERDAFGVKVAQLPSGIILKLFRRKRRMSSSAWLPYGRRFVQNAERLAQSGVPTVRVRAFFHCPEAARHVVAYRPLVGEVLRHRLARRQSVDWSHLAGFMAQLHRQGIYFRSLHSGNIVCLPQGGFGLIDIADLRLCRPPLGAWRRARNLRPLLQDPDMHGLRGPQAFCEFLDAYRLEAGLGRISMALFSRLAWRQWRRAGAQSSATGGSDSGSSTGSR